MGDVSRPPVELPQDDARHGTTNGYGNLGCRCASCTEAHRQQHNRYMQRVRETKKLVTADAAHGTSYRYDVGCRCDPCREAHNRKSRATKQRLTSRRQQRVSGESAVQP